MLIMRITWLNLIIPSRKTSFAINSSANEELTVLTPAKSRLIPVFVRVRIFSMSCLRNAPDSRVAAVSYTHLDVYKRQATPSPRP